MTALAAAMQAAGVRRQNYRILNKRTKTQLVVCPECYDFLVENGDIRELGRTDSPCTRITGKNPHGTKYYDNF